MKSIKLITKFVGKFAWIFMRVVREIGGSGSAKMTIFALTAGLFVNFREFSFESHLLVREFTSLSQILTKHPSVWSVLHCLPPQNTLSVIVRAENTSKVLRSNWNCLNWEKHPFPWAGFIWLAPVVKCVTCGPSSQPVCLKPPDSHERAPHSHQLPPP